MIFRIPIYKNACFKSNQKPWKKYSIVAAKVYPIKNEKKIGVVKETFKYSGTRLWWLK